MNGLRERSRSWLLLVGGAPKVQSQEKKVISRVKGQGSSGMIPRFPCFFPWRFYSVWCCNEVIYALKGFTGGEGPLLREKFST
jgi:hypothetical protein